MMLFNKLLQAVPILSFSVNADMPVGMLPIDFDPGFNQAVIPLLFAVSSYADDSFLQAGTPFSGEKGKKFGMTQAFFTSFQLSASCCVRTTSASSFLQPPPVSFSNAVRFACMGIPVVPSDAGYECMVWLYGILLFYASIIQLCQKIQFSAQCADDNIRFQGFQPILQLLSVQVHQGKIIISSY